MEFKLKEYSREEIPEAHTAAQAAIDVAARIANEWTKGKVYTKNGVTVNTYNQRDGDDFWMARVSKHSDVSFEQFQRGILEKHTENEQEYIQLLDSFKEIDPLPDHDQWRGIQVHYKFPTMFSDREMTVWIMALQPDPAKKQFAVVSLPADEPVDGQVTRAYYCSLEVVTYLEDQGCVEWVMAQASDARGNIPRWIQDRSVTASVVEDVPSFLDWVKKQTA